MEEHIVKFIENDLTSSKKLKYLEDSHLKEMGITNPGERISILSEVKEPSTPHNHIVEYVEPITGKKIHASPDEIHKKKPHMPEMA